MAPIKITTPSYQAKKKRPNKKKASGPEPKLETTFWAAADKLRGNMDAAEYKHVALGLIFLKYISDAFEEFRAKLNQDIENPENELYVSKPEDRLATLEDRDEYVAANIFWVPKEARWQHLLANAKQPTIGKTLDDAMIAIERDNPSLKGVLPKDYARPALDKQRLGEVIDLIGNIAFLPSPFGRGAGGEGLQSGTNAGNDFLPSPSTKGTPAQKLSLLPPAQEHILGATDGKERLLRFVHELSLAFALAVPHSEAIRIRDDVGFFQAVRSAIAKETFERRGTVEEMNFAIRQIISRAISSDESAGHFRGGGLEEARYFYPLG